MKNLFFLSIILLFSCDNKNTSFGDVKIDDDNSKMIQKLFESVEKEEIEYLKQVFSEDLEFTDSHGKILNKEEFIAGVENIFDLFDDIKFKESQYEDHDNLEIETTYYSNGNVWTSIWSEFSAKGKYTNENINFPFHISYEWKGGKIIREVQFFSTKAFDTENEAKDRVSK